MKITVKADLHSLMPDQVRYWKMPPLVKIYEAIGTLADGRIKFEQGHEAQVASSDGSKVYHVEISDDGRQISSNDNASYWQGYLGYPAIAILLMRGLYSVRPAVIEALKGIPWRELNRQFRNDYERTISEVLQRAKMLGFEPDMIVAEVEAVLTALRELRPRRGPRRRPPIS